MFITRKPRFLMDADRGAGGGPGADDKDPNPNAKGDPNAKGGDENPEDGGDAGGDAGQDEKKFSQAELDRIVAERLERAKRRRDAEAERQREAAEAELLKEKEDFKSLAEKQEAKIKTLEGQLIEFDALKETHAAYEGALQKYLDEARKDLPKHILALLDKLSVVDQLEYIAANAAELSKPKSKGLPETPDEAKSKDLTDAEREALQARSTRMYRNMF